MKTRRQFDIDILKLSNSKHNYEFDIESSFFDEFEDSLIQKGHLKVLVILDKSTTMIQATFQIEGTVELVCDRSLEPFDEKVSVEEHLIFKFGEEFSELTEEIITIPRDLSTLNVSQYIYEFIGLAIPMKKLHPKFRNEESEEEEGEEEETDAILIYSTKNEETEEDQAEDKKEEDPRWDILKNIKNNLN